MSDEKLDAIISNEKEWRRELFKQVADTRQELHDFKLEMSVVTTSLKIKIGLISAFFGIIGGALIPLAKILTTH